jgi:hypothetical protein
VLDDIGVKEKHQIQISNSFAALENLDENFDFNNAWESIRQNIETSAEYKLRYHRLKLTKPWFDE